MKAKTNLRDIIKNMSPYLNQGEYVFLTTHTDLGFEIEDVICQFREEEGITLIINKIKADELNLNYDFVASWITLKVHSSLNAVGLTSVIATELTKYNISCNIVAGYYHDHLFVNTDDKEKAIKILEKLSNTY